MNVEKQKNFQLYLVTPYSIHFLKSLCPKERLLDIWNPYLFPISWKTEWYQNLSSRMLKRIRVNKIIYVLSEKSGLNINLLL